MNRQQRRREKREEEKNKTAYNLTKENIQTIRKEARKEAFEEFKQKQRDLFEEYAKQAIDESFQLSLGISLLFFRDKLGYGSQHLRRSMEELVEYYNDWTKKRFNIKDVLEAVEEETGYKFDFECDVNKREIKLYESGD